MIAKPLSLVVSSALHAHDIKINRLNSTVLEILQVSEWNLGVTMKYTFLLFSWSVGGQQLYGSGFHP